ncbi:MAG: TIM-barrel domain-containing protein [Phycisphaerales bacterium]
MDADSDAKHTHDRPALQSRAGDLAIPRSTSTRRNPRGVLVGDRVARFFPADGRDPAPFPAYLRTPEPIGPLPVGWSVRPTAARVGKVSGVEFRLPRGTSFYGTGEQAGPLLRNGKRTTLWNTDAFDYNDTSPSLYQSHPFVLCVRPDGTSVGIIVETTHRCAIDLRRPRAAFFATMGPAPACLVIERDHPQEVVEELARLTGLMPMPPAWALGYHQCRWSYESAERAESIARGFRDRRIPCDCLWLDIDYMRGFRCFTFDDKAFPNPKAFNDSLHERGFKAVWMIDPGLKVDPEYSPYAEASKRGLLITSEHGGEYHGKVWPGDCAFPDFTRADTREWWATQYSDFLAKGVDGVWNDMNEPAVFDAGEKTMPATNRHAADDDLGGPGDHARYHNIYGMQMVRATRTGIERLRPGKRPFVLTRANFLGGQRYAACWTGDNRSDWRHLRWSIPMALNLSMSGQPFCGPDIGGFVGNADADLFATWMGVGALLPFARGHSIKESVPHEPWSFGETCERLCRLALERRMRLLPYLYSLFHVAATKGTPIVRPVFFDDPKNPRLRALDSAFLLGPDILVVGDLAPRGDTAANAVAHASPAVTGTPSHPDSAASCASIPGVPSPVVFNRAAPAHPPHPGPSPHSDIPGHWVPFEPLDVSALAPEDAALLPRLPRLFVRKGRAIPLGPVTQFITTPVPDSITLAAAFDDRGEARCALYQDAGDGPCPPFSSTAAQSDRPELFRVSALLVRKGDQGHDPAVTPESQVGTFGSLPGFVVWGV